MDKEDTTENQGEQLQRIEKLLDERLPPAKDPLEELQNRVGKLETWISVFKWGATIFVPSFIAMVIYLLSE